MVPMPTSVIGYFWHASYQRRSGYLGPCSLCTLAHIDDVLLIGLPNQVASLKAHISNTYRFKDLGPVARYTGIYIQRD